MWNEILGALTILAMVVLCANASRIVEALCDRIRYGVQAPLDDIEENTDEAETPAEPAAKKPVAAATSKTVPAAKPAAARNAA